MRQIDAVDDCVICRIDQHNRGGLAEREGKKLAVGGESRAGDHAVRGDAAGDLPVHRVNADDRTLGGANDVELAASAQDLIRHACERDGAGVFEFGQIGDIDGFFRGAGHEKPRPIAFGPLATAGGKAGDRRGGTGGEEGPPRRQAAVKVRQRAQNRIVTKAGRPAKGALLTWNFTPHGIG